MTKEDFYNSAAWKRKRASILRRDNYLCKNCKRFGRIKEATEVHHIKHYEDYPDLALTNDNLISLCHSCHNKQHPEKGGYKRY